MHSYIVCANSTVADFGLSLMMPPDNFRIAEEYQHHGTPGNRAPEHSKLIRVDGGDAKMMTSKTNVWSVGIVLWSMIVSNRLQVISRNYS